MVVVLGAGEAEVRRGERFVELRGPFGPRAADRAESGPGTLILPAHARLQAADEVPLVDDVRPPLERAHAGFELDDRRDRRDAAQLRRRRVAVVAGELQRQVAAE